MTARMPGLVSPSIAGYGTSDTLKPTGDKKFEQESEIYKNRKLKNRPVPFIRNGYYQHIFHLGIVGYVIVNHYDNEIVLVDPWPSYMSHWVERVPIFGEDGRVIRNDTDDKQRVCDLANFLRKANEEDVKTSCILLSHMHFDHTEDIALLLDLLMTPIGHAKLSVKRTPGHTLDFNLEHRPFEAAELPVICADFNTIFYLKAEYFGINWWTFLHKHHLMYEKDGKWRTDYFVSNPTLLEDLREHEGSCYVTNTVRSRYGSQEKIEKNSWKEITVGGKRVFYDDGYNDEVLDKDKRVAPGTKADTLDFKYGANGKRSSFVIEPYVWDHANTPPTPFHSGQDELHNQAAGSMQRITAFRLYRRDVENAKKTFIVGSAGEMNQIGTEPNPIKSTIETDLLIQAVAPHKYRSGETDWPVIGDLAAFLMRSGDILMRRSQRSMRYVLENIKINDFMVMCHFEEFVRFVALTSDFEEAFKNNVYDNIRYIEETIDGKRSSDILDENKKLLSENKIFVLARRGQTFELSMPAGAATFHCERPKQIK